MLYQLLQKACFLLLILSVLWRISEATAIKCFQAEASITAGLYLLAGDYEVSKVPASKACAAVPTPSGSGPAVDPITCHTLVSKATGQQKLVAACGDCSQKPAKDAKTAHPDLICTVCTSPGEDCNKDIATTFKAIKSRLAADKCKMGSEAPPHLKEVVCGSSETCARGYWWSGTKYEVFTGCKSDCEAKAAGNVDKDGNPAACTKCQATAAAGVPACDQIDVSKYVSPPPPTASTTPVAKNEEKGDSSKTVPGGGTTTTKSSPAVGGGSVGIIGGALLALAFAVRAFAPP